MASIAWWWAFPALALVLAIGWAAWVSRAKRSLRLNDSVERYRRFRDAMERDGSRDKG